MLMLLRAQRLETIGASWCIMAWITQRRLKKRNWTGGEVLLEAFTSAVKYCVHKRNVTVWYGAYILFISLIFLPLFYSRSLSLSLHSSEVSDSFWIRYECNWYTFTILRLWISSESHGVRFRSDCGHVQLRCGGSTSTKGHAPKAPSHFRAEPKPLLLPWSCKVFQCNFSKVKDGIPIQIRTHWKDQTTWLLFYTVEICGELCNSMQQHSGQLEASDFIQPHGIPPACNQLTTPQLSKTSNAFWGEWLGPPTKRGCSSCATISISLKSKGKNANHQGTCWFDWNKYCIVYG